MLCASPYVTTVLFCIKETQGRNQRFSSQVRMILRRSTLDLTTDFNVGASSGI